MNEVTIMTALTHGELTDQTCQKMTLAKQYLDEHCPLDQGSHTQVTHYLVYYNHLMAFFADGSHLSNYAANLFSKSFKNIFK